MLPLIFSSFSSCVIFLLSLSLSLLFCSSFSLYLNFHITFNRLLPIILFFLTLFSYPWPLALFSFTLNLLSPFLFPQSQFSFILSSLLEQCEQTIGNNATMPLSVSMIPLHIQLIYSGTVCKIIHEYIYEDVDNTDLRL